ncbi:hypothetical protein B0H11DRAFT_2390194 [Mycena galericulata]|nr:hypothetical protein B0H11DRAFT_2390194 [Mycena galericulata]
MVAEYPAVLGGDIAGVVEQVGEEVQGFSKGVSVTFYRGFQQYATVPAAGLIRKPKNLSFDEATTFPITFSTACVGLFAPAPIGIGLNPTFSWDKPHQGESALIIGAGTSTGQFAIQLLKFLGFTRIVAYASKVHFDYLKELGATDFIDRAEVPLDSLVVNPPVKVVYDVAGGLNAAYDSVVDGGKVVAVIPPSKCTREGGKKVTIVYVHGYLLGPDVANPGPNMIGYTGRPEHTVFGKLVIKNMPEMMAKGVVLPNRFEVLPKGLAGILAGLERMKAGGVSGVKLIAHPHD